MERARVKLAYVINTEIGNLSVLTFGSMRYGMTSTHIILFPHFRSILGLAAKVYITLKSFRSGEPEPINRI